LQESLPAGEILAVRNQRYLDLFINTTESFLVNMEGFMEVIQGEEDHELLGPKLKLIKAEHQLFILTIAQIGLEE